MIKTANDAYLAGRHAALVKLAKEKKKDASRENFKDMAASKAIIDEYNKQKEIAALVGLTSQGLLRNKEDSSTVPLGFTSGSGANLAAKNEYTPAKNLGALLTHENAARLAMLAGTAGGTYLGGQGPRSAALSAGGSMLGAMAGGNLGRAVAEAANAYMGEDFNPLRDSTKGKFVTYGGALGGLGGGLAAGRFLS